MGWAAAGFKPYDARWPSGTKVMTKATQTGENDRESKQAATAAGEQRSELPPAAVRALKEAEERRKQGSYDPALPLEVHGRKGPEPVRYGDWEKDGIASDF
jgi:hypothetical protein